MRIKLVNNDDDIDHQSSSIINNNRDHVVPSAVDKTVPPPPVVEESSPSSSSSSLNGDTSEDNEIRRNLKEEQMDVTTTKNHHQSIPIIIFTYKRAEYLKETIDTVLKYMPDNDMFHLYISQDGDDESVKNVVDSYSNTKNGNKLIKKHFQRERNVIIPDKISNIVAYYSIAQHYKYGINSVFEMDKNYDRIIILEEDLRISHDFFDYFSKMSKLLDRDTSLFCVSAWNDNGLDEFSHDSSTFYRSDFFPGLGWMMKRKLWEEDFELKWPLGFWDDWVREGPNRKGRACIRPEISRTFTFGFKGGASSNQFSNYLNKIKLNTGKVDWNNFDLNSLVKSRYDEILLNQVKSSTLISTVNDLRTTITTAATTTRSQQEEEQQRTVRIVYRTNEEYLNIANTVGIMADIKAGVPRGAYLGIVTVKLKRGLVLYITPPTIGTPLTYTNLPPYKLTY